MLRKRLLLAFIMLMRQITGTSYWAYIRGYSQIGLYKAYPVGELLARLIKCSYNRDLVQSMYPGAFVARLISGGRAF